MDTDAINDLRITCSVVPCLLAVLASVSCTSTEPSAEYLRASIDGAAWEAGSWQNWPVDGLYHHGPYETPFFAIGGVGVVGPDRWQLGIYMPPAEGTYILAPTATTGFIVIRVIGGATNGVADIIFNPDSLEPGTVTLTHWDPERRIIEGTFSLRGREHGTLESVSMTHGAFRVRYDDPSMASTSSRQLSGPPGTTQGAGDPLCDVQNGQPPNKRLKLAARVQYGLNPSSARRSLSAFR